MRISDWSSDVCSSDLLVLAARGWYRDAGIRFTPEELALRSLHFDGLSAASARRLIDQGHWISARRGEVLIRENQAAPSLFYLAEGRALIQRDGADVGPLADGALTGGATVRDGAHATGTDRERVVGGTRGYARF